MVSILSIVAAMAFMPAWASSQEIQVEPMYRGKSLSYWVESIRNRDEEVGLAFDAIHALGPEAWPAVRELSRIVAEPFTPVRIGLDKSDVIEDKLLNVQLRTDAIDALAAIGPAASSSAVPLIRWALTDRAIPDNLARTEDLEVFIEMVAVDVLQRMRVAGVVASFGRDVFPVVAALLGSPDDEERKLAVAILSEKVLPVAVVLLKSRDCEDRELGIDILHDMWPVMREDYLAELRMELPCTVE